MEVERETRVCKVLYSRFIGDTPLAWMMIVTGTLACAVT
jgi:hypothetical protein